MKTGKALVWIDPQGKAQPRVLLFLVQGAADIEPLAVIESACRPYAEGNGFTWHPISDPGQISLVDSRLFRADIVRFETCEFAGWSPSEVAAVLASVLGGIVSGNTELLPTAGGAVGSPAEGIQFLNRVSTLGELTDAIRRGESLALQSPRRMGKTSLMRRLQAALDGEFKTLALNLERDPTLVDVAARLRSHVTEEGFRTAFRAAARDPLAVVEESMEALCQSGKPLILFVDEFVALFESIKSEGSESEFRARTLACLDSLGGPLERHGARLVVASSVDWVDHLRSELGLDLHGLPHMFARVKRVPLKPLDFEHPEFEVHRLLLGSGLVAEPGDIDWLRDHLDLTVPFPALRFLDVLSSETRRLGHLSTLDFDQLFLDYLKNTESFDDFDQHLRRKSPGVAHAADIVADALNAIAREPFGDGASEAEVMAILTRAGTENTDRLLAWLRDTFPVTFASDRARFVSRLFRHWWRCQNPLETGASQ